MLSGYAISKYLLSIVLIVVNSKLIYVRSEGVQRKVNFYTKNQLYKSELSDYGITSSDFNKIYNFDNLTFTEFDEHYYSSSIDYDTIDGGWSREELIETSRVSDPANGVVDLIFDCVNQECNNIYTYEHTYFKLKEAIRPPSMAINIEDEDLTRKYCSTESEIRNFTFLLKPFDTEGDEKDKIPIELETEEDYNQVLKIEELLNICGKITFTCEAEKICGVGLYITSEKYAEITNVGIIDEGTHADDGLFYKEICTERFNRPIQMNNILASDIIINGNIKFYTLNPNVFPFKKNNDSDNKQNEFIYPSNGYNSFGFKYLQTCADELFGERIEPVYPFFFADTSEVQETASFCYGISAGMYDLRSISLSETYYNSMSNTTSSFYSLGYLSNYSGSFVQFYTLDTEQTTKNLSLNKLFGENSEKKSGIYLKKISSIYRVYDETFDNLDPFDNLSNGNSLVTDKNIISKIEWDEFIYFSMHKLCFTRNRLSNSTTMLEAPSMTEFNRAPEGAIGYAYQLKVADNSSLNTDFFTFIYAYDPFAQALSYVNYCPKGETADNINKKTYCNQVEIEEDYGKSRYETETTFLIQAGKKATIDINTGQDVIFRSESTMQNGGVYSCIPQVYRIQNQKINVFSYSSSSINLATSTLPWARDFISAKYVNLPPDLALQEIRIIYDDTNEQALRPYIQIGLLRENKTLYNNNLYEAVSTLEQNGECLQSAVRILETITDSLTVKQRETSAQCKDYLAEAINNGEVTDITNAKAYYINERCIIDLSKPIAGEDIFIYSKVKPQFRVEAANKNSGEVKKETYLNVHNNVFVLFEYPRKLSLDNMRMNGYLILRADDNTSKPNQIYVANTLEVGPTGKITSASKNVLVKCTYSDNKKDIKNTIGGSSFGCGSAYKKEKNTCPSKSLTCIYPSEARLESVQSISPTNYGISSNYFVGSAGSIYITDETKPQISSRAGGVIILQTCNFILNGEINANGEHANVDNSSSAGSGGSIRISISSYCKDFKLSGSGVLSARGGNGVSPYGAGSGGLVLIASENFKNSIKMSRQIKVNIKGGSGDGLNVIDADDGFYHNIPLCGYKGYILLSNPNKPSLCRLSTVPLFIVIFIAAIFFIHITYCIVIYIRNKTKRDISLPYSYNPFRIKKHQIENAMIDGRAINIVDLAAKEG